MKKKEKELDGAAQTLTQELNAQSIKKKSMAVQIREEISFCLLQFCFVPKFGNGFSKRKQ
jgi:hypothetical protein